VKRQRILVIEDEFPISLEIASALEDAGFSDVEQVDNEPQALHRITTEQWDGVVADANLNGQGIERVVVALYERSIPFIIVTGYTKDTLPASIKDAPVIEKPFYGPSLTDALHRVLEPRRS
jgi:DNA-binding NtrC family response regulator